MYRLELRFKNLTIREYNINEGDVRYIGRALAAHINIDQPDVSRRHACIKQLNNELFIWDEGSKHGTMVNGLQVICAKLNHGDVVLIGSNHKLKASIVAAEKEGTLSGVYDKGRNLMTTT